jgi:tetratricopeptide (TPR) repeat protein
MKACVVAALNAANGRANVAIEIYKNGKPKTDAVAPGNALPAGFVAPPRTIADITAILDSEKPDPATLARLKASADNEPGKSISQADLAQFYIDRGAARSALGRNREALADGEKALVAALASGDGLFGNRTRQFIILQKLALGDIKGALQISQFMITDANRPGQKGWLFNAQRMAARILVQMGDIPQAEVNLRRSLALLQEARTSGMPGWRTNYNAKGRSWEGEVEAIRAIIFEARGQFREAEAAYAKSREWNGVIPDLTLRAARSAGARGVRTATSERRAHKAKQVGRGSRSRCAERVAAAEGLGKYNPLTTPFIMGLANILVEEGRYGKRKAGAYRP